MASAVQSSTLAPAPPAPLCPRPWLAAGMLCWREIIRFLRQRNRIVGALLQPILFWLLFGAGLNQTFRLPGGNAESGQSFSEYYFPGTLAMILLFTAIFATVSVIEDRREGFLQSVLVAPIPRWSMVLGKVLGGALLALLQGLIFLLLALTLNVQPGLLGLLALVAFMFVLSLALTALGMVIAWRMESTQGFHAIMTILLMPMWLLSGAFFPTPTGGSLIENGLRLVMTLNPLTYGVAGMRLLLFGLPPAGLYLPSLAVCWGITILFAIIAFAAAWLVSAGRTTGDLL